MPVEELSSGIAERVKYASALENFSWVEGSFFLSIVTFLLTGDADARSRISFVLLSQKKKKECL